MGSPGIEGYPSASGRGERPRSEDHGLFSSSDTVDPAPWGRATAPRKGRSVKRFVSGLFPVKPSGGASMEHPPPLRPSPRPVSFGTATRTPPERPSALLLPPIVRKCDAGSSVGGKAPSTWPLQLAKGKPAPAADSDLAERPKMPDEHSLNDLRREFTERNSSLFTLWSSSRSLLHADLPGEEGCEDFDFNAIDEDEEQEESGYSYGASGDTVVGRSHAEEDVALATRGSNCSPAACSSRCRDEPATADTDAIDTDVCSRGGGGAPPCRRTPSPAKAMVHAHELWNAAPEPPPIVHWKRGDLIGRGAHGRVYLALSELDGALMAVKSVELLQGRAAGDSGGVEASIAALQQEIDLMKQLNHANIVRYRGTQRTADELHIFMDFVPGGSISSLLQRFGPLSEGLCCMYAAQILRGLAYLHGRRVVHRDIKGANILVDMGGVCKLADFGACKSLEQLTSGGDHASIRGTPYWIAPEVVRQTPYSPAADIWSVGCTVIEMATGKPPFSEFQSPVAALFHIATSREPPALPQHLSPLAQDFLRLCMNPEPELRPSALELLKHPFVTRGQRQMGHIAEALSEGITAAPSPDGGSGSGGLPFGDVSSGDAAAAASTSGGGDSLCSSRELLSREEGGSCACFDCHDCSQHGRRDRNQEREYRPEQRVSPQKRQQQQQAPAGQQLLVYREMQRLQIGQLGRPYSGASASYGGGSGGGSTFGDGMSPAGGGSSSGTPATATARAEASSRGSASALRVEAFDCGSLNGGGTAESSRGVFRGGGHGGHNGPHPPSSSRPPSRPSSSRGSRSGSGSGSGSGNGAGSPAFGVASDDEDGLGLGGLGDRSSWAEPRIRSASSASGTCARRGGGSRGGGGGSGSKGGSAESDERRCGEQSRRGRSTQEGRARNSSDSSCYADSLAAPRGGGAGYCGQLDETEEEPRSARLRSCTLPERQDVVAAAAGQHGGMAGARERDWRRKRIGSLDRGAGVAAAAAGGGGRLRMADCQPPQQQQQVQQERSSGVKGLGSIEAAAAEKRRSDHSLPLPHRLLRKGSWSGSFIRRVRSEGGGGSGGGSAALPLPAAVARSQS